MANETDKIEMEEKANHLLKRFHLLYKIGFPLAMFSSPIGIGVGVSYHLANLPQKTEIVQNYEDIQSTLETLREARGFVSTIENHPVNDYIPFGSMIDRNALESLETKMESLETIGVNMENTTEFRRYKEEAYRVIKNTLKYGALGFVLSLLFGFSMTKKAFSDRDEAYDIQKQLREQKYK